jgi:hypothetical protein
MSFFSLGRPSSFASAPVAMINVSAVCVSPPISRRNGRFARSTRVTSPWTNVVPKRAACF